MPSAVIGDTVKVHYTGRLDDQSVFDSSLERDPLQFTIGAGQVIPGFEEAVIGLAPGESTTARIAAENAYGERREDLRIHLDRTRLPSDLDVTAGDQLEMRSQDGQAFPVEVVSVGDSEVIVDANHPLAGKDLTFEIELVAIV